MMKRLSNAGIRIVPPGLRSKFALLILVDMVAAAVSVGCALLLSTESLGALEASLRVAPLVFGMVCIGQVLMLCFLRIYNLHYRYLGFHDVAHIGISCLFPGATLSYFQYHYQFTGRESGLTLVFILYVFIASFLLTGIRLFYRQQDRNRVGASEPVVKSRTIIVGAGDAGDAVLREFERKGASSGTVVGFVDDSPLKASLVIRGVPVLGPVSKIEELVAKHRIDDVLVALPSASGAAMKRVFEHCGRSSARVRTLPGLQDLIGTTTPLTRQLREIRIEDLLRREPVSTDHAEIENYIAGRTVLITGGGGSIGSELARQVARMKPAQLVLVGKGENSLYEIQQELLQTMDFSAATIVADVKDHHSMARIFETYKPTAVFHAAAHKHVPLMEGNVLEAVRNNVLGTLTCARLAIQHGAEKFTLISTDKAVQPSNVMGATKRLCEMVVNSLKASADTKFSVVRFGNVLGSRGSLVPLLNAQIRRGGPVTVTDSRMTRYFMTIPEAVQLVLQATALSGSGDTFILDMGDPVRIEDIALELIRLHGLMPGDDIAIKYIGIRPGEKLHEELVYDMEVLEPTKHPKIRTVQNQAGVEIDTLIHAIDFLIDFSLTHNYVEAKELLMQVINSPEGCLEAIVDPIPSRLQHLGQLNNVVLQ